MSAVLQNVQLLCQRESLCQELYSEFKLVKGHICFNVAWEIGTPEMTAVNIPTRDDLQQHTSPQLVLAYPQALS